MHWVGITGSWRQTSKKIERDVRDAVAEVISVGGGIITGGAPDVDAFAIDEVLQHDPDAASVRILLPAPLPEYEAYYNGLVDAGAISGTEKDKLMSLLREVQQRNPKAIRVKSTGTLDTEAFFALNDDIISESNSLLAFWVNNSTTVGDAIHKAQERGMPVRVKHYEL